MSDAGAQRARGGPARDGPGARLSTTLQRLLPQHAISRGMHWLTRRRARWFKNAFIRVFVRLMHVDMRDAARGTPDEFASFNDFFTRELRPDARPLPTEEDALVSPVDGTLSACGDIQDERLFQAKGHDFSLQALLGEADERVWGAFRGGRFCTIYLAPYNYHRIHMPLAGTLRSTALVPGRLFSVNAATAACLDGLYARNERVVCLFDTGAGPLALVLVGALCVGSIETPWLGEITPGSGREPRTWPAPAGAQAPCLGRGEEMGRFNMGSTVIALFAGDSVRFDESLAPGCAVRMGERIGQVRAPVTGALHTARWRPGPPSKRP